MEFFINSSQLQGRVHDFELIFISFFLPSFWFEKLSFVAGSILVCCVPSRKEWKNAWFGELFSQKKTKEPYA